MDNVKQIKNSKTGVAFNVVVEYGGGRGTDATRPVVKFYDSRYRGETVHGQFFGASYYLTTILTTTGGLNLDGGIPSWSIDSVGMDELRTWLHLWIANQIAQGITTTGALLTAA